MWKIVTSFSKCNSKVEMVYRIIKKLKDENVLNYYVYISATSIFVKQIVNVPQHLFDWDQTNLYHSINEPNQSIRIDFPATQPYIEKIIIKTGVNRDPYNWKVEGSENGADFIDLVVNDRKPLCSWGKFDGRTIGCLSIEEKSFSFSKAGYYQSIRLKQTGPDSNNELYLILNAIDFEGRISITKFTCKLLFLPQINVFLHLFWS